MLKAAVLAQLLTVDDVVEASSEHFRIAGRTPVRQDLQPTGRLLPRWLSGCQPNGIHIILDVLLLAQAQELAEQKLQALQVDTREE